jgi:hypothetical protein
MLRLDPNKAATQKEDRLRERKGGGHPDRKLTTRGDARDSVLNDYRGPFPLPSYNVASRPPSPLPSFDSLSQSSCLSPGKFTYGGEGRAKSRRR